MHSSTAYVDMLHNWYIFYSFLRIKILFLCKYSLDISSVGDDKWKIFFSSLFLHNGLFSLPCLAFFLSFFTTVLKDWMYSNIKTHIYLLADQTIWFYWQEWILMASSWASLYEMAPWWWSTELFVPEHGQRLRGQFYGHFSVDFRPSSVPCPDKAFPTQNKIAPWTISWAAITSSDQVIKMLSL